MSGTNEMAQGEMTGPAADRVPFRVHPRVFEALGERLVTSDVVAVLELVKNSYDAWAERVDVRFRTDAEPGGLYLEVQDNGEGMTREIIEEAWCVIATPYRANRPISKKGERVRRASGEKGLGRLSAMRLGQRLHVYTRSEREPCWEVHVDWRALAGAEEFGSCYAEVRECDAPPFHGTGTFLRVEPLSSEWGDERIDELRQWLARLISPFEAVPDFEILLTTPEQDAEPTEVESPEYLAHPPYAIKGTVDGSGLLKATYGYSPPTRNGRRKEVSQLLWPPHGAGERGDESERPVCGAFGFEIRAWDFDTDALQEIGAQYQVNPQTIKKDIGPHSGISVYRDGVLVLPKTASGRDWLGLDRRRVSLIGKRLDSKQIISHVALEADRNPGLRDTSDRERLEDNEAARDLKSLLMGVVDVLETERERDREPSTRRERPLTELLSKLSAQGVVDDVRDLARRGGNADDALALVEDYIAELDEAVGEIQERLIYYSRLATVGSLAAMLIHEVRNQTTALGAAYRTLAAALLPGHPDADEIKARLARADVALRSLERLADRFAPLARRMRGTRRRDSVLEAIIEDCVAMRAKEIRKCGAAVAWNRRRRTRTAVDPGELVAVVINLLDNSIYWLEHSDTADPKIEFTVQKKRGVERATVEVHDNGPGIEAGDEERVFWPGVTRKPEGIGMGLTVAAEIVAQYGGKMYLRKPGQFGGATFGFDIPLSGRRK